LLVFSEIEFCLLLKTRNPNLKRKLNQSMRSTIVLIIEHFDHVLNDEHFLSFPVIIGSTIFIHTVDWDQLRSVGGIIVY
jgi:hypothetical protein